ncbi:MAG: NUMOD4 motif-containing HNH endonuclease [Phycisphaerae bacterium]|nr:NUMOD4 motif-containing HNH endonuclease [Phycisphaerae bacterium]
MNEEWRPIEGSDGLYSVSSLGRVRSEPLRRWAPGRQRGRILACNPDSKGYPFFAMCIPQKPIRRPKVHRVVAATFIGPCPEGMQVNHKNGNKADNRVENLEYVTCMENIRHGWRTGLYRRENRTGEKHGRAKVTNATAALMRQSTESCTVLGRRYRVSRSVVSRIKRGLAYAV